MNGEPLEPQPLKQFLRTAEDGDFIDRLLMILPHTGMTASEFTHMHDAWLDPLPEEIEGLDPPEETTPIIRIPAEAECRGICTTVDGGIRSREGPCAYCQELGYETWFPGWPGSECRQRTIPVPNEDVVETLYWWFSRYSSTPIGISSVCSRLQSITERAGLQRDVTPRDLRATYPTILARMGFPSKKIAEWMGIQGRWQLLEFFEAADVELDWSPHNSDAEILGIVAEHGDVTNKELAEELGIYRNAAHKRIQKLVDQGLLEEVGERREGHHPYAKTYAITDGTDI